MSLLREIISSVKEIFRWDIFRLALDFSLIESVGHDRI